jgi:plastocyanin
MSLRAGVFGLLLALGVAVSAGCKKEEAPAVKSAPAPGPGVVATTPGVAATTPGAAATVPAPAAGGVRKVPIEVVEKGYSPDRIPGKPGEKLSLVFTRKVDGHCYEELKTPDGKRIALPKNEPVEVPVTVPQDGEVRFACGMDMLEGVVVAEKS